MTEDRQRSGSPTEPRVTIRRKHNNCRTGPSVVGSSVKAPKEEQEQNQRYTDHPKRKPPERGPHEGAWFGNTGLASCIAHLVKSIVTVLPLKIKSKNAFVRTDDDCLRPCLTLSEEQI